MINISSLLQLQRYLLSKEYKMNNILPPEKPFRVNVDITSHPAIFTYFNRKGAVCNGSVDVTEKNTCVSYTLINNTDQLIFAAPVVDEAEDPTDLTFIISRDQQTLSIYDNDLTNQKVSFRLVVVQANKLTSPYISADPVIRSIPS